MLPDFLADSYRRYKDDTNAFTTWLSNAARACGYKSPVRKADSSAMPLAANTTGRLKGKARKLAKLADKDASSDTKMPSKILVSTEEILAQAEAIALSARRPPLPPVLVFLVRRAITARQRFTTWFKKNVNKDLQSHVDDERHEHYTATLAEALRILIPCYPAMATSPEHKAPADSAPRTQTNGHDASIRNRLSMLDLHEPEDFVDLPPSPDTIFGSSADMRTKEDDVVELDLFTQGWQEYVYRVYCFFEDMHTIQHFLQRLWQRFHADKLDLLTATVTTNTAVDLVRQLELSLLASLGNILDESNSYSAITQMLFFGHFQGDLPSSGDEFLTSMKDQVNQHAHAEIDNTMDFTYRTTALTAAQVRDHLLTRWDPPLYPLPFAPFRLRYIKRPDLLHLPKYKQFELEHERLAQMMQDTMVSQLLARGIRPHEPRIDSFTKAVETYLRCETDAIWDVFAFRVFLDIQNVLQEDITRPWNQLQQEAAASRLIMNYRREGKRVTIEGYDWHPFDWHLRANIYHLTEEVKIPVFTYLKSAILKERPIQGGVSDPKKLMPHTQFTIFEQLLRQRINPDELLPSKNVERFSKDGNHEHTRVQQMMRAAVTPGPISKQDKATMKRLDVFRMHWPATELEFIYSHNPLRCGTVLFDLRLLMEETAVKYDNHYQSTLPMAHLYNALRQKSLLLDVDFPELDRMIDIHFKFLFGSAAPSSCEDAWKRLAIKTGMSPTVFAKNARLTDNMLLKSNPKMKKAHLLKPSVSGELFRSVYKENNMDRAFAQLEAAMREASKQKAPKATGRNEKSTAFALRHLSPLQFLEHFSQHVPQMGVEMDAINIIVLTRMCNDILIKVRDQIEEQLGVLYPNNSFKDQGTFIPLAMLILEESGRLETGRGSTKKAKGGKASEAGPQLKVVAEVMKEYLLKRQRQDSLAGEK